MFWVKDTTISQAIFIFAFLSEGTTPTDHWFAFYEFFSVYFVLN